jgi:hypothetical protein
MGRSNRTSEIGPILKFQVTRRISQGVPAIETKKRIRQTPDCYSVLALVRYRALGALQCLDCHLVPGRDNAQIRSHRR